MSDIKKKLAVIGSRTFTDKKRLYEILTKNYYKISMIVSGGARGPDSYAVEWAADYGVPYLVFPALWHNQFTGEYDAGAGFRRNIHIIKESDLVMAFYDGKSRGTRHALDQAELYKKPVKIFYFDVPESIAMSEKLKTDSDIIKKSSNLSSPQDLL